MTEQEYINATDRVKISNALNILREVCPKISTIIDEGEFAKVMSKLNHWESRLFGVIDIKT